jgi:hypothetical protein
VKHVLKTLAPHRLGDRGVKSVSLVGSNAEIGWQMTDQGLVVVTPGQAPNDMAICYRIETIMRSQAEDSSLNQNKIDRPDMSAPAQVREPPSEIL